MHRSRRRSAASRPPIRSRKGELKHINPFTLLVAVVLSAQATDAGVNKATPALFALADTPEKMVALGEEQRARPDQDHRPFPHQGQERRRAVADGSSPSTAAQVPRSREALEALPGVGRKTANVVLNIAFGEPTIAVDTHIFRVGNRTGMATGKKPFEVEQKLEQVVPAQYKRHAHHWLILHGRYTCLARKPRCEKCIIADLCQWPGKTVAEVAVSGECAWKARPAARRSIAAIRASFSSMPACRRAAWRCGSTPSRSFATGSSAMPRSAPDSGAAGQIFSPSCRRSRMRTSEQKLAADIILLNCRDVRERFLAAHAESVYRKLTNKLEKFLGVDELVYEAGKLVPGLAADPAASQCRKPR